MRTPFVVGNWKLHKTIAESLALVTELKNQLGAVKGVAVGVAPVFTAIQAVAKRLEGSSIATCGQDCHWEARGAWTGEVSPDLLADAGASWVIIGHSERRQFFGETNDGVARKTRAALAAGLGAIVCVGESLAERDAGRTLAVVDEHLGALAGIEATIEAGHAARLVIAYEPVWAIGTGRTATPAQAQEVHAHIRRRLVERLGAETADAIRIQYGGSVKPGNAEALMAEADIDGALVGGASLEAADFVAIVKAARSG
ncbi:MAG TPA: triose-phosphate isomerase [Kofleriaceae bacterium]|jgi:triosephosphate isomerase|nr:triose-phosphate isomerase [Kofleriaceae bacterium]